MPRRRRGPAWDVVAGITAGQDISDREVQLTGSPPQFCLGKSFTGYGPIGPAVVSVDAFADPDDIALRCEVWGEVVQEATTAELIFDVPRLVVVPLLDLHAVPRRPHLHRDSGRRGHGPRADSSPPATRS